MITSLGGHFEEGSRTFFLFSLLRGFLLRVTHAIRRGTQESHICRGKRCRIRQGSTIETIKVFLLTTLAVLALYHCRRASTIQPGSEFSNRVPRLRDATSTSNSNMSSRASVLGNTLTCIDARPGCGDHCCRANCPSSNCKIYASIMTCTLGGTKCSLRTLMSASVQRRPRRCKVATPSGGVSFHEIQGLGIFFSHGAIGLAAGISRARR